MVPWPISIQQDDDDDDFAVAEGAQPRVVLCRLL